MFASPCRCRGTLSKSFFVRVIWNPEGRDWPVIDICTLNIHFLMATFLSWITVPKNIKNHYYREKSLGGGNSNVFYFIFTPESWGFMILFDKYVLNRLKPPSRSPWNSKQPVLYGCFNWMMHNLYMGNGCFTKHPLKTCCLEFQDHFHPFKTGCFG